MFKRSLLIYDAVTYGGSCNFQPLILFPCNINGLRINVNSIISFSLTYFLILNQESQCFSDRYLSLVQVFNKIILSSTSMSVFKCQKKLQFLVPECLFCISILRHSTAHFDTLSATIFILMLLFLSYTQIFHSQFSSHCLSYSHNVTHQL